MEAIVPPTPGAAVVPGLKPSGPYSTMNEPVHARQVQETVAAVAAVGITVKALGAIHEGERATTTLSIPMSSSP